MLGSDWMMFEYECQACQFRCSMKHLYDEHCRSRKHLKKCPNYKPRSIDSFLSVKKISLD